MHFNLSEDLVQFWPHASRESNGIGLLLTSVILARRGNQVIFLGADVPGGYLFEAIRQLRPRVVLMSAATSVRASRLEETVLKMRSLFAETGESSGQPFIGYGGRIFVEEPERRGGIDAEYMGPDARESAEVIDRLIDRSLSDASGGTGGMIDTPRGA